MKVCLPRTPPVRSVARERLSRRFVVQKLGAGAGEQSLDARGQKLPYRSLCALLESDPVLGDGHRQGCVAAQRGQRAAQDEHHEQEALQA